MTGERAGRRPRRAPLGEWLWCREGWAPAQRVHAHVRFWSCQGLHTGVQRVLSGCRSGMLITALLPTLTSALAGQPYDSWRGQQSFCAAFEWAWSCWRGAWALGATPGRTARGGAAGCVALVQM